MGVRDLEIFTVKILSSLEGLLFSDCTGIEVAVGKPGYKGDSKSDHRSTTCQEKARVKSQGLVTLISEVVGFRC